MKIRLYLLLLLTCLLVNAKSQTPVSGCETAAELGVKFFQQANYRASIPYIEKFLKHCVKDTMKRNTDYYMIVAALAISYYEAAMEDSCIATAPAAVKYFEAAKDTNNHIYHNVLVRLGMAYDNRGMYEEAIGLFEKSIRFWEKTNVEYYIWYALKLGTSYSAISAFDKSMSLNKKVLNIIVASGGANTDKHIAALTNIGNDFAKHSLYDSALAYHSKSLSLREKLFGTNDIEYAKGLSNVASMHNSTGQYADAVALFEKAKTIYEANQQERSVDYGNLLGNMGMCYMNLEQYDRSFDLLIKSLTVIKAVFGQNHVMTARGISNIALWSKTVGGEKGYADAVKFYTTAKEIMEKISLSETSEYATVLSSIGDAYGNTPKLDSAIYFLEKSLALKRRLKLHETENYAITLGHLGGVYSEMKDYDNAIKTIERAISLLRNLYGDFFPTVATGISNLGNVHFSKGNSSKADSLFKTASDLSKKYVLENTEGLSESEKEGFAQTIRLLNFMALNVRKQNTKAALQDEWLYNSSLFYKGLLLQTSRGLTKAFSNFSDTSLRRKGREFLELKAYIGKELLQPVSTRTKALQQLQNKATDLERELSRSSTEYRDWKSQYNVDWKQLREKLKDGEAAIEFVSYNLLGKKYFDRSSLMYVALLIRKDMKEPVVIPLFSDSILNKLISRSSSPEPVVKKLYRSSIKGASSQPQPSDSLYHLIWKPLLPHLDKVTAVYFSADGVINNLNLAAIINPEGKRLVEQYDFVQLSSTRNLMKVQAQPAFNDIHLWGGVQYGGSTSTKSSPFSYLPGSLKEIQDIASLANKSGKKIKTMAGDEASEASFKNLNGKSPEVLHIATHGFFFPDPTKATSVGDNRFAQSENPLLRSGLALAGANSSWSANSLASNKEDGILTAYEIADMDLSNTKLVVLSACETGLGDIKSGEGVYGLQRAFKMAGVNYLIMSLWQVPDMETKEFMKAFYSNCTAGMPIRKAFRETQLMMNKKYEPYQWAAFVLVE